MRIARWEGRGLAPVEGIVHDGRLLAFPTGTTVQSLLVAGLPAGSGGVPPQCYEFPTFYFSNPHSIPGPTRS